MHISHKCMNETFPRAGNDNNPREQVSEASIELARIHAYNTIGEWRNTVRWSSIADDAKMLLLENLQAVQDKLFLKELASEKALAEARALLTSAGVPE